jgi:hypothetical protein
MKAVKDAAAPGYFFTVMPAVLAALSGTGIPKLAPLTWN